MGQLKFKIQDSKFKIVVSRSNLEDNPEMLVIFLLKPVQPFCKVAIKHETLSPGNIENASSKNQVPELQQCGRT